MSICRYIMHIFLVIDKNCMCWKNTKSRIQFELDNKPATLKTFELFVVLYNLSHSRDEYKNTVYSTKSIISYFVSSSIEFLQRLKAALNIIFLTLINIGTCEIKINPRTPYNYQILWSRLGCIGPQRNIHPKNITILLCSRLINRILVLR